jgi:5-(carboxyamino)imidazole ribonucleotide synthase
VLHTTQHRLREKTFLRNAGLPVTEFWEIRSLEDLQKSLRGPSILKSADFGYDGKGQHRIQGPEDAVEAWAKVGPSPAVLEAFVDFACEVSVVAARSAEGDFVHWGAIENSHRNGILDISVAPARVSKKVAQRAVEIARVVLEKLDVVGVLCVEFFVTRSDDLLINELAPRPHNSGHVTFDACVTSQFEQQLRAVCGLPLGSTRFMQPAAMANLLGDVWNGGEPDWAAACAFPDVKVHLYGKLEPRPGRKMGHLTALGDDAENVVTKGRAALTGSKSPLR